jgi:hypothetical protein
VGNLTLEYTPVQLVLCTQRIGDENRIWIFAGSGRHAASINLVGSQNGVALLFDLFCRVQ